MIKRFNFLELVYCFIISTVFLVIIIGNIFSQTAIIDKNNVDVDGTKIRRVHNIGMMIPARSREPDRVDILFANGGHMSGFRYNQNISTVAVSEIPENFKPLKYEYKNGSISKIDSELLILMGIE